MESRDREELRKLKRVVRFLAGDVGLVSSELYVLLYKGEDGAREELCVGLREAVESLVCHVQKFAGAVEALVGGAKPPSAAVNDCFEQALVCLADALTEVCEVLTVDDWRWFMREAGELFDEALRSNEEADSEGAFYGSIYSGKEV